MSKVVAMIDQSLYAESVCDYAGFVASKLEASLEIVHVLGRREASGEGANLSGSIGLGARTALLEELAELDAKKAKLVQQQGRAILDDAKARALRSGVSDVTTLLRNGEIVETAQDLEADADLIVIGKRGQAADFDKLHLGSNLERVVRSVTKPVLVASRAFQPIERMMIAFDGGTSAMKAVDHIARSKVFGGLDLRLVVAGQVSPEIRKKAEDAAILLKAAGYNTEAEFVSGSPDKAIAEQVKESGRDLLIMGAYGHSRIRNLIIGSTTTEMIRSCKIPILLFR